MVRVKTVAKGMGSLPLANGCDPYAAATIIACIRGKRNAHVFAHHLNVRRRHNFLLTRNHLPKEFVFL